MSLVIVRHCAGATGTRPENRYLPPNHIGATNQWLQSAAAAGYDGFELDAPNGKVLANDHGQFVPDWPSSVAVPDLTLLSRFPRYRMAYLGNPVGAGDDWRAVWKQTISRLFGWCTHAVLDAASWPPNYTSPRLIEAVVMLGQAGIRAVVEAQVPNLPSDPALNAPAWMVACGVMFRSEWMRPWSDGLEPPYHHPQQHPEAFCLWDGAVANFPDSDLQVSLLNTVGVPGKPGGERVTARWCAEFQRFCEAWRIVPMLSSDWAGGPTNMRSLMATAVAIPDAGP